MSDKSINLTTEQLREILVDMAREIRKPADPTPQEAAQFESEQRMRAENAKLIAEEHKRKRWMQEHGCAHQRANGSTTCVHVANLGVLICQHCQALIYPEGAKGVPEGIYDTALFNKHFSLSLDANGVMA